MSRWVFQPQTRAMETMEEALAPTFVSLITTVLCLVHVLISRSFPSTTALVWVSMQLCNVPHNKQNIHTEVWIGLSFLDELLTYICFVLAPTSALKKFLLYVRRSEIRGVDIDNPYMNVMTALTVPDIDDVTVVDYDALEERIYWADVKTQTIKRAFINGTGLQTVISGGESRIQVKVFFFLVSFFHIMCGVRFFSINTT